MLGPRAIAAWAMRTQVASAHVEGLDHVPRSGPVLIVARHYHHLVDGAMLITFVPRPVHIVVGLDWATNATMRRTMETVCRLARYPVVLRAQTVDGGAYARDEVLRYTRSGLRDAVALLAAGRVLVVFPEGYPNVDPAGSRKTGDGWLPFASGFTRIARAAERAGAAPAIVPAGFAYARNPTRWDVTLRFGAELRSGDDAARVRDAEAAVRELSRV